MMVIHLRRALRHAAVVGIVLGMGLATSAGVLARASSATEIDVGDLPKEGRAALVRIHAGGPFRYSRDGVVFNNRERLLPPEHRGYYHEYTVTTPGSRDRGARRIICGGEQAAPVACWYTDDHYQSFRRIRE